MITTNRQLISECWHKLRACKHLSDLLTEISQFPKESGSWKADIPETDAEVLVIVRHDYYEDAFGCMDYEEEKFTLAENDDTGEVALCMI